MPLIGHESRGDQSVPYRGKYAFHVRRRERVAGSAGRYYPLTGVTRQDPLPSASFEDPGKDIVQQRSQAQGTVHRNSWRAFEPFQPDQQKNGTAAQQQSKQKQPELHQYSPCMIVPEGVLPSSPPFLTFTNFCDKVFRFSIPWCHYGFRYTINRTIQPASAGRSAGQLPADVKGGNARQGVRGWPSKP